LVPDERKQKSPTQLQVHHGLLFYTLRTPKFLDRGTVAAEMSYPSGETKVFTDVEVREGQTHNLLVRGVNAESHELQPAPANL
jgi:hypothetical protein